MYREYCSNPRLLSNVSLVHDRRKTLSRVLPVKHLERLSRYTLLIVQDELMVDKVFIRVAFVEGVRLSSAVMKLAFSMSRIAGYCKQSRYFQGKHSVDVPQHVPVRPRHFASVVTRLSLCHPPIPSYRAGSSVIRRAISPSVKERC